MNQAQREKHSAKHIRRMKLFERAHLRPVYNALHTQIIPVIEILREHGVQPAIDSLDAIQINSHLSGPIRDIYSDVGLYFANKTIFDINQSTAEQKAGFGFNAEFLRDILAYFNQLLLTQVVLPVSQTTKDQILEVLTQGFNQGWGAEKLAQLLESPELLLWRARLIVRTESNKAMNYGQKLGESKAEWESIKQWIDAKDGRERASHLIAGGQVLDMKDKFLVPIFKGTKPPIQIGVDLMSGPGDPNASAGNICNCRCVLAFRAKRDANGALIRKTGLRIPAIA